jgi:lysyl-tRNA synthetase class 2
MPSSVIARFKYEPGHKRLTVTFVTGRVYEYLDVPADVAAAFKEASSKGTYFNAHIRDHYRYRELTPTGRRKSIAR